MQTKVDAFDMEERLQRHNDDVTDACMTLGPLLPYVDVVSTAPIPGPGMVMLPRPNGDWPLRLAGSNLWLRSVYILCVCVLRTVCMY